MRRYDLDWLRVGVFGLLILYHVGMFFVPWGWHLKNDIEYPWLSYPMLFINQWRLPILFLISGMGTFYALNRRNGLQFIGERIRRLLLPLIFGILIIVPPQVYLERIIDGSFQGSYLEFWTRDFFNGVYPEGNFSWHHLWFLPYLLVFSLVLSPLFIFFKRKPGHPFFGILGSLITKPGNLYLFIIPLYLFEALLEPFFPVTHALYNDWFSFINYMYLFLIGFLLIALSDIFWPVAVKHRRTFLYMGILGFISWIALVLLLDDSIYRHFSEALLKVFNMWSWILVLFGYASRYLNRPSRILAYCNEAVYPFYILHQTVTLCLAFLLLGSGISFLPAFIYLAIGTFAGCWILYEFLIRRITFLRPLFGLKVRPGQISGYGNFQKSLSRES